jgi:outer membrane protein assembly factor BamB
MQRIFDRLLAWSLVLLGSSLALPDARADNWPGFLGAGAAPLAADSVPLAWTPSEHIAWKARLAGYGQSSPVIWDGKVFVTSVEGPMKDTCHIACLNLAVGSELWKHSFESSDKVESSHYVSRAAPTPVCDGNAVYVFFESGDVASLTLDGQPRWRRSLSRDYGQFQNKFGLSASPVQTDDSVIILVDDEGPSYLIALSKADGQTLWKTDRTSRVSWSSPALVNVGGQVHVVCSSAGSVDGYDPLSGKLLWSFDEVAGNTAATPLPFADGQFLVGATPGREGGARADGAKDSNLAMSIDIADGKPTPRVRWRTHEAMPSFGSPMVYAGHAYWVNRLGVVYCFDAATGESRYTERIKQSCWATPVGVGDRVYFFGKDGTTTVLQTGPKFVVLAENQLWDPAQFKPDSAKGAKETTPERQKAAPMFSGPVQYGIAIAEGSLLIRSGEMLYCIR